MKKVIVMLSLAATLLVSGASLFAADGCCGGDCCKQACCQK